MSDYIRTRSGARFCPWDPKPDTIHIEDIAAGLSRVCRWNGQSNFWYPVAAHSIHVASMLPRELRMQGLLHDASEAYIADIPSPVKARLPDYQKMEENLSRAICTKFGLPWPLDCAVKNADMTALFFERTLLFTFDNDGDVPTPVPVPELDWNFPYWVSSSPTTVYENFLSEFYSLGA